MSEVQPSHGLSVGPSSLQTAKEAYFPSVETSQAGVPNKGFEMLPPQGNLSCVISLWNALAGALITSPPFLSDSMYIFLTVLLIQESFCQSPVIFQ